MSASNHRRVRLGHPELLQHPIDLRIGLHVHPGEQNAVLGQEVADPKSVRRVARADHPQSREGGRLLQKLPAGDERLKNDVAQIRALVQEAAQGVTRNFNHLTGASGDSADHSRGAGQVGDFAGELALAMDDELFWLVARQVENCDLTRLHDEELHVAVADSEQRLPILKRLGSGGSAAVQSRHLGLVKRREGNGLEAVFGHVSGSLLWNGGRGVARYIKGRYQPILVKKKTGRLFSA